MIIDFFLSSSRPLDLLPLQASDMEPQSGFPSKHCSSKSGVFWLVYVNPESGGWLYLWVSLWILVDLGRPRCRSPPCFWSHRFWVRKPGAIYLTVYFFREDGTLSYPAGLLGGILLGRCGWPACLAVALRVLPTSWMFQDVVSSREGWRLRQGPAAGRGFASLT